MIADETFTTSFSPDGSSSIEFTKDVPTGELWYIDSVTVTCDGAEANSIGSKNYVDVSIGSKGFNYSAAIRGHSGVSPSLDPNRVASVSVTVGAYATGEEKILVGDTDASTSSTMEVIVKARRVL